MNREPDTTTNKHNAKLEDVWMAVKGFVDRLISTEDKIDHLERLGTPSHSEPGITKE